MSEFAHTVLRAGSHVVRLARRVTPILTPGSGWSGATEQPAAVGDLEGLGYSRKPMARWDSPIYTLDVTDSLCVGIPAFHINAGGTIGIDYVEIAAEGGEWVRARRGVNPDAGVLEYYVRVRASDFDDGTHELRARVYPVCGVPRVLGGAYAANGEHSIWVTTNAGATLPTNVAYVSTTGNDTTGNGTSGNPYATIMRAARAIQDANGNGNADGGIIYLAAGSYQLGTYSFSLLATTVNRWLTITHAPGLTRADVTITGSADSDGIRTKLVRLYDVTVTGAMSSNGPLVDHVWFDTCNAVGAGRTVDSGWYSDFLAGYWTNCSVSNCRNGPGGSVVRGCTVNNIGSDAFSLSGLVANCTASNIDASGTSFHADVRQAFGEENWIIQSVTATDNINAQGIFAGNNINITDAAVIDVTITTVSPSRSFSLEGPTTNTLVRNSTFLGVAGYDDSKSFSATDVVFESTNIDAGYPGVVYR